VGRVRAAQVVVAGERDEHAVHQHGHHALDEQHAGGVHAQREVLDQPLLDVARAVGLVVDEMAEQIRQQCAADRPHRETEHHEGAARGLDEPQRHGGEQPHSGRDHREPGVGGRPRLVLRGEQTAGNVFAQRARGRPQCPDPAEQQAGDPQPTGDECGDAQLVASSRARGLVRLRPTGGDCRGDRGGDCGVRDRRRRIGAWSGRGSVHRRRVCQAMR